MAIEPGQVHHERYRFERLIGQGAFGVTWRGQHLFLNRPVAIKVIDASRLDEESRVRAIRECQIGGQLSNPHIVNVLDAYEKGTDLCIVMEFMAGGSLKDYLTQQQPALGQGLRWAIALAQALAAVHSLGIVHRDIKPANILLTENNAVKIADFGIAHLPGSQLTGAFQPGTPAYRSPEQEANQPVDAATDVYALSVVLFEMFSGEKFFNRKGVTLSEWRRGLRHQLARRYPGASEMAIADLADALADGLAVDRSARSSLSTLQQALTSILNTLPAEDVAPDRQDRIAAPETTGTPPHPVGVIIPDETPISRIDRYELQALIGQGGMGKVHKAYDPRIDRLVALKTITIVDPSWRARFQREVRIAGRLNHPHIVTVYDVGELGEVAYIVMELIEGQTLADLLPSRLAWSEAVKLLLPVCQALAYAHKQGVIHRDVKPANVLLAADGRVKLTDFGIARLETSQHLTQTGAVLGTPLYMAPEQLSGKSTDERTDIFALGVILFELVAGQNPFGSQESIPAAFVARSQPPDLGLLEKLAPQPLQATIRRAMADAPADRFRTAGELAEALAASLDQELGPDPPGARNTRIVTISTSLPQIELGRDLALSSAEQELMAKAFSGHDRLYVENELRGPTDLDRLLVVLPVRSGRPLARIIVKLASPESLSREWKAYQEYVADILPLVTGHIQGAPLLSPDRKLALLLYTFAGDIGAQQAESLANYYQTHPGMEVAGLLERNIFQVVAPSWWLNRETTLFPLRREYGYLLPVHLVVEKSAPGDSAPLVLKSGSISAQNVANLQIGKPVHIQGFRVQATRPEQQALILEAPTPAGKVAERFRLEITGLSPDELHYRPGDLAPNFTGTIITTRDQLLREAVQHALPDVDLTGSMITLGTAQLSNPLQGYEPLLERSVSGMRSIIHGDLTLESVLVEPESGLSWLINFANTRTGHNLYDFLQLETEIVSRILPDLTTDSLDLDNAIIATARLLHSSAPARNAGHSLLQKPYELLRTIRRLASRCMLDPDRWDEYYLGLMIMLLGALPAFKEQPARIRLIFLWAAVAGELVDQPLQAPPAAIETPADRRPAVNYIWPVIGVVAVIILLGGGLLAWFNKPTQDWLTAALFTPTATVTVTPTPLVLTPTPLPVATPTPTTTPTASPTTTLTPSPTATLTATPTPPPTASPTSTPGSAKGRLTGDLNVYRGPGTAYTFVDNADKDTVVEITGQDKSGNWWYIVWPNGEGWVDTNFVEVDGTPNLPQLVVSPPPTFTPTATHTFTPLPPTPTPTHSPTPTGSPTAPADAPRQLASDTVGYQHLFWSIGQRPTASESFSPFGQEIGVTDGNKLYVVTPDGSAAEILMEEDETIRPVEGVVWSPNGSLIAFVADLKRDCYPECRRVGIFIRANIAGGPFYLEPPAGHSIGLPRWTQDGRLLVNVYKQGDPASGTVYVYAPSGQGQVASGTYVLSSSHEGQKWHPWLPGKTWRADQSQPTGYYQ